MCSGGGGGGGGSAVGMATNIIGSEMERWAAILSADAMNKQFSQQMKLQNMYRNQGMGLFGQYAPSMSSEQAQKDMSAGAANRVANYNDIQARSLAPGDKSGDSTNAQLAMMGQQRARLDSYGDWQSDQSGRAADFQTGINRIASRASGSASVFPYQMSHAQHGMDWLNMLGEMIKGVGGASTNFGMLTQQPQQSQTSPSQDYAFSMGQGPVSQQGANQYMQNWTSLAYPSVTNQMAQYYGY